MRMKCDCGGKYDSSENNSLLKVISVHKGDAQKAMRREILTLMCRDVTNREERMLES